MCPCAFVLNSQDELEVLIVERVLVALCRISGMLFLGCSCPVASHIPLNSASELNKYVPHLKIVAGIRRITYTVKVEPRKTVDRISQVALEILEREGPEAVTMRRVAQRVGITPMAIYHHYPNREALLNTITDREFAKLKEFIESRPLRGTAESRLLRGLDAYVDYAFARPRIFDYVFSQPRAGARRYPEDFRARRSPTLTLVADAVESAMKAGYLKKDDVWEVTLELWAHVHGYVMFYRAGRFNLSQQQFRNLVRRSFRRLIHGLKA